ncbi:prephenate dehydrogenase [Haloechinothrix halophila]|uniref:prephenate dehydrogenase n=1 Tax=Haloechinothrix halophila TaxID=1069073 RepID=UPI0004101290|nr:prephenate dehydrogenase [Haloechinothrix halophila]
MRDLCVIGLGLIGGSLLRAATQTGRTAWGATESSADADAARTDGFDVEPAVESALRRAAERDAMIVLAVPLTEAETVLRTVAELAPHCLLTDVTSVKSPIVGLAERIAPQASFVGGHPMAGTTRSGWQAGDANLFAKAAWVVCVDEGTDLASWAEVAELAIAVGAEVVPTTSEQHDEAVARISHLPHLLAAVLAHVGAEDGALPLSLAAGSFSDGTRVAATRPELTRAMAEGNRAALLPVLDSALGMLGAARGALASTGSLGATINAGYEATRARATQAGSPRSPVRIELTAADAPEALLALGSQGGRVTELSDDVAVGALPMLDEDHEQQ